jgi:hypothetical protein
MGNKAQVIWTSHGIGRVAQAKRCGNHVSPGGLPQNSGDRG